jgi:hypothetical protein
MATSAKTPTPQPIVLRAADDGPARTLTTDAVKIVGTPRRVRPGAARDASGPPVTMKPDDVVRVEYDNGLAVWVRADDLLRERGRKAVARSDGTQAWDIDTAPSFGAYRGEVEPAADRGALGLGIKVLEFFGVEVTKGAARTTGKTFERKRLGNEPGLYRVAFAPALGMTAVADGSKAVKAGKPVLLFLHGTMSSFAGSYKDLAATASDEGGRAAAALRAQLATRYQGEVYAWEHRTLTESPIRNALDLVLQLPRGTRLHLVSHSRGGLVGELLCLGQRDKRDDPLRADLLDTLFAADRTVAEQLGLGVLEGEEAKARDAAYAEDRKLLAELLKELDTRDIAVTRFVRVACPARGTTLASGRLDRWLSVIDLILPDGLFGDVVDFLLAVVKERTDPRTLPGVEAMMPGSALTRLLHLPQLTTTADLSVISGDVEGKGLWGQLKLLATDWFYGADHDLVVNTGSMVGGIARPAGVARFRRDQGEQVTHFNYFRNKLSIDWLAAALAREEGADAGFLPIAQAKLEEPRWRSAVRASRSVTTPRPIAIVVPGTMGSALNVQDRPVWLAYWALMKGGLGDIGIDAADVHAVDLLDDFYGPLIEHLTRTHRVEILPYDWRLSVREAAIRLAAKLEAVLPEAERTRQPVHIVAHSMGGLVSRSMIADGGAGKQAWQRMTAIPGSRLLMLGTPNAGSHEAVRWLTGFNPTQAKLILLDFTRGTNGIIDVVRRFPGVAELLPFDQDPNPWAQAATWRALKKELGAGWTPVEEPVLRQAQATWKLLRDAAVDPEHMVYVAGCQPATVVDHEVVDEEFGFPRKQLRWIATAEGDGTVPWASGRLPGVPLYFAPDTGHDQLCSNTDDRRIFRGYVDLLLTGRTDQLSTAAPGRGRAAGAAAARFVLPDQPVTDDLPDEAMVRSLGFGGTRARPRRTGQAVRSALLQVGVRHGDLRYARHPVLVGHYQGDTIVSAEASLDQQMRGDQPLGPLSRRRDLGLYPGPTGTHAVFFNELPGRSPDGALVVGLGQVGELSPSRLEAGVRDLLLEYALRLVQRRALLGGGPGRINAGVSSLLVGTGASSLNLRDSMEALLRGALAANRKLEDAQLDQQVLIDRIEFTELFEDIAISAAKELGVLLASGELGPRLAWPTRAVEEGEGRKQRSRFDADQSWWQRIEIIEDRKADRLRFVATADRARAEESLASGQLRLADGFIAQACGSARSSAEVSKTLFEMLLPNRLKESAPDQRSMVLLLDEASARFPWELLEDRWSHLGRPPAVVGGIVRQLKVQEFRAQPAHAFENTLFVVGNPDLDGWSGFADLPGARREAERVRDLFGGRGYDVSEAIDAPASRIVDGLHSKAWRVLHLAGHGEHQFDITEDLGPNPPQITLPDGTVVVPVPQKKTISGMVIGKGTFLTPGDVQQMRNVPELVFVNCCHLGQTGGEAARYNKLAANLGVEFIRMGVRAVVCAGWAVDDAAALTFAEKFYAALLDGDTFGQAVLGARQATWAAHPGANTWGAYQCYGDPGYRLMRDGARDDRAARPDFFAPSELATEVRNLAESVRMRSKEKGADDAALQARLRQQIDALIARVPAPARGDGRESWLVRADVCAALGFAYGEGRMFVEAVEWLNKALSASVGDCPVRAAEQCANFTVRLAALEWAELRAGQGEVADDDPAWQARRMAIAERIEAALYELDVINTRAPTFERRTLLGSACKRLAWVQAGRARVEALLNMAAYYRQAFDDHQQRDAYAFNNWAIACLMLERIDPAYGQGDWHPALAATCEQQLAATRQANEDDPSFWGESGVADLNLVELLLAAGDKAACADLAKTAAAQYATAFARGASLREVASIQEHLDFLIALTAQTDAQGKALWPRPMREALESVRRSM